MSWNECLGKLQKYLENKPLIVLGSGASISSGLPSMNKLAEQIKKSDIVIADPKCDDFFAEIDKLGLEVAIDAANLSEDTRNAIKRVVWEAVNKKDLEFFDKHSIDSIKALIDLIKKILSSADNKAVIVTTNYDRLAEYAVDLLGATAITGFEGSLIKQWELPTSLLNNKRIHARERVVDIWKVHGSLDWFKFGDGNISAFPLTRKIPYNSQPLIIPPGKEKYSSSHNEPYRTVISQADKAFESAAAYLCIGYGFNDEHIQPKLLKQVSDGKPIVILSKEMTDACKKLICGGHAKKISHF